MAELRYVTIDCADHVALSRFWAAALAWTVTYCEADGALLKGPPPVPQLFLQPVAEAKIAKNRVHVDLGTDRFAEELARLLALGATPRRDNSTAERHSMVLADPEGNEFCLSEELPAPS